MYYLYRYTDLESNIAVKMMISDGYPFSQEAHYTKFGRTTANVDGRKDNTIIVKPFNVLCVPAPRPQKTCYNGECSHIVDITVRTCLAFIKTQPLHTDLSKIDITTIYPELFI